MTQRVMVLLGCLAVVASALWAHDLFIKLDSYFVEPDTTVRIPVLNGTFRRSENSITSDRLRDLSLVLPTGRIPLATEAWEATSDTSFLTVQTGRPGTYVVGVSTTPSEITLTAEEFNEYLETDGIPDVLAARRQAGQLDQPATERYHKHVKAIFEVGGLRTDTYQTRLGYPAEIVPLSNPYELEPGDLLLVRCLVDGRPVENQLVIAGGQDAVRSFPERAFRTDEDGVAAFTVDAAGKWYVKFIHMEPALGPTVDYESKWATLTFEIRWSPR